MANASFVSAFLFSIFAVTYLSGNAPCPARPAGKLQRAEGREDQPEPEPMARLSQSPSTPEPASETRSDDGHDHAGSPRYVGLSGLLAELAHKLRKG